MIDFKSCITLTLSLLASSPAIAEVRGLYGSECMPVEGLSAKKDLFFQDQSMETVQTVYADTSCSLPVYDFSFLGDYVLDPDQQSLDYSYSSIKLRALDVRVADAFNQIAFCGYDDWTVNVAREVAGKECEGQKIPQPGTTVFDLVHESADQSHIQLGRSSDARDGLSAETRPDELDSIVYSAK